MEETKVTFETAKLAKEKGFKHNYKNCIYLDEGKFSFYQNSTTTDIYALGNNFDEMHPNAGTIELPLQVDAPTQSLLQKWLREVHKLDVSLHLNQFGYGYMYAINDVTKCKNIVELKGGPDYKWTYEEALEVGLQEALKLIK